MMRATQILLIHCLWASGVVAADDTDESKAIAKIELLGGTVERDATMPDRPVVGVDLTGSKKFNDRYLHLLKAFPKLKSLKLNHLEITDDGLLQIGKIGTLTEICLCHTRITDEGLRELRKSLPDAIVYETTSKEGQDISAVEQLGGWVTRDHSVPGAPVIGVDLPGRKKFDLRSLPLLASFASLTTLNVSGTEINDVGLWEICERKTLASLNLWNTQVTDDGVKELLKLENLTRLNLGATRITDEGLKEIARLENLTRLDLDYTQITDSGLAELQQLAQLTDLDLGSTKTTESGVQRLKAALPNLRVRRE